MKLYQLEKPDISKYLNDDTSKKIIVMNEKFKSAAFQPEYLYWDKLKYKMPEAMNTDSLKEQFWLAVKEYRKQRSIETPIKSEDEKFFTWIKLPQFDEFLHRMDLEIGGNLLAEGFSPKAKNEYISRGVLDEAIASSQLEGASTTRQMAKKFIREGRKPKNKSEQMILNNYKTMRMIENNFKNQNLSKEMLLELHQFIVEETMPVNDIGRFRNDSDGIVIDSGKGNLINFKPPKALFVENELETFIQFANDRGDLPFIHPVIKAIMLHFWMGYLHPFCDGNGRLARILFYWYLIRKGYWGISFLPISALIMKTRASYEKAYIYSEQDDNDLTYFIDYNITKIQQALEQFKEYSRKRIGYKKLEEVLETRYNYNYRQIALLIYFKENPGESTNPTIHKNTHQITKMTAIKDLKQLISDGFLLSRKRGKNVFYYPTDQLLK